MKQLLVSMTDAYQYEILWVPVSETTADTSIQPADLTKVINAIFAVQVEANATVALSNPAASRPIDPRAYFGYDSVVAWAAALTGADNPNDNARVVASIRALSSVAAGTATGTVRFATSGERRGDLGVINYKKTGAAALSRWNGPVRKICRTI
jgi:ABC-type branched-subunit amino acid transport system substrate-binding protein